MATTEKTSAAAPFKTAVSADTLSADQQQQLHLQDSSAAAASSRSTVPGYIARLLTIIFFALLIVWVNQTQGGFGTQTTNLFGLHALLMSFFVFVTMQESILAFASPMLGLKSPQVARSIHIVSHLLGVGLCIGGLASIVKYKNQTVSEESDGVWMFPFFHLYSPHSYCAILFLCLWFLQLVFGITFSTVLSPSTTALLRKYHSFLGRCVYAVGAAVCAMGLQNMQSSDLAWSMQTPDMIQEMNDMMAIMNMTDMENYTIGYDPYSSFARLSAGASVVIITIVIATFSSLI